MKCCSLRLFVRITTLTRWTFVAALGLILALPAAPPDGYHRIAPWVVPGGALYAAVYSIWARSSLVDRSWTHLAFAFGDVALAGVTAHLTGGLQSPLVWLLLLPGIGATAWSGALAGGAVCLGASAASLALLLFDPAGHQPALVLSRFLATLFMIWGVFVNVLILAQLHLREKTFLDKLHASSSAITRCLESRDVLAATVTALRDTTGADFCCAKLVSELSPEPRKLCTGDERLASSYSELVEAGSLHVVSTGLPLHADYDAGVRMLALPVRRGEQVTAVAVAVRTGKPFEQTAREVAELLVQVASANLHKALLLEEAVQSSQQDPLTGLANRRQLEIAMSRLWTNKEQAARVGVIYTDIDGFKGINDNYGHPVGDEILKHVGRVLSSCVRKNDLVARLAGDEFVVVCPESSTEEMKVVIERGEQALRHNQFINARTGEAVEVTLSWGIAETGTGSDPQALLERADRALYFAKSSGRGSVCACA